MIFGFAPRHLKRYALLIVKDLSWKPSSIEVLPETFDEVVAKHKLAVFHFWAAWNQYDRLMDDALQRMASEYGNRIFVGCCDVDRSGHWKTTSQLRILNIPALTSFANGKHLETVIGMLSETALKVKLKEWVIAARA